MNTYQYYYLIIVFLFSAVFFSNCVWGKELSQQSDTCAPHNKQSQIYIDKEGNINNCYKKTQTGKSEKKQIESQALQTIPQKSLSERKKNSIEIFYVTKKEKQLSPGEQFQIKITLAKDAFVYCYFETESGEIVRFYPNRFKENAFVSADSSLVLPGNMPFDLFASLNGINERIACFAADNSLTSVLPENALGTDFEPLPFASLEQIRKLYSTLKNKTLTDNFFDIHVR